MINISESVKRALYDYHFALDNRDYTSEIQFWDNHLAMKDEYKSGLENLLDKNCRRDLFPTELEYALTSLKNDFPNKKLRLLEIGSGPTSNLASGVDRQLFDIIAIDPLADTYKMLMKKYGYDFPIKPLKGTGEELLKLYDPFSFHIAYSQNAVDHASDPEKCISNMYKILKINGIICLKGNVREASNQGWNGLHQHDLEPFDNKLLHTDSTGKSADLIKNTGLKQICLKKTGNKPGDQYTVIYKKYS